jgi:hypothetical protein
MSRPTDADIAEATPAMAAVTARRRRAETHVPSGLPLRTWNRFYAWRNLCR